jgi:hypothetical protein
LLDLAGFLGKQPHCEPIATACFSHELQCDRRDASASDVCFSSIVSARPHVSKIIRQTEANSPVALHARFRSASILVSNGRVGAPVVRWFRTNRRFAGTLALFALALQFTLAFGHIHLRDFAGVPGVAVAQAQATTTDPADDHNPGHSIDGYCLICATTNVAGTLVLPDLVALPVPVASIDTSYGHYCSTSCSRIDHALFRARAPPFA